ncbi:colanic acid biosynthesis glycosyltransferase WcaI [Ramlibacter henchirensis]|uniref:Colanic acid biosynthesis glycosyltransferase WcaI n=1 Tax=Ramlibacter henchirensis TaxID=204072 RepID=A0A4Z0BXS9_9BURK|nr:glycosyltransferase WbuB [Ramlibacter henchirensis]TFZ03098.1 colanic acid biosynthesis glycosyltransferase WcaI [Ramlibacter henchirensis]
MRILLYGINFSPELTGIGKYTGELAAWLAAKGHEVRVVTAPPYYPEWKVKQGYSNWLWRTEQGASLRVMRCPLWVPKNAGGLKRMLHLASFAITSLPVVLRQIFWKPQLVWVVEPTLACAPAAALLAAVSGGKSWLHIQDFEIDAAFEMGLLKGDHIRRFALAAERWLMRRFDRVSTISGRMMDRARSKQLKPGQLVYFPNWVDISLIQRQVHSSYRAELGIPADAVVALYSGNMGNKQGLEILADAARLLQSEPRLHFVFCGQGTGKQELERRCEGLTNVRFLPLQPLSRLSDLLALADVHLLPQRADAADLVMPSKLGGMLASGRPVVATAAAGTELSQVVAQRAEAGLVVPPEQPEAFAQAISALMNDPQERERMGASGRAFAEREIESGPVLGAFEREVLALVGQRPSEEERVKGVDQQRPNHQAE